MVSVRRAHLLLLVAVGVGLLLLLLSPAGLRLSVPPPPPPDPVALPLPVTGAPRHRHNTTGAPPPPPPPPANRTASPAPPPTNSSGPPETRRLYVSGHPTPHTERCPGLGAGLAVLILVSSAPAHRRQRDAVRLTWGHYAARADVAMAFLVGQAAPAHERALRDEDALYGDIVRGAFVDSYRNLTLKSLSMLEWCVRLCPRAPMLLKADDDVFVNVRALLAWARGKDPARPALWGRLLPNARPRRDPKAKYYLPNDELPGAVLPAFLSGPAYAVSRAGARALLSAGLSPGARYVRLEDVYVTGVSASRARPPVPRHHDARFYNRRPAGGAARPCAVRSRIALHDLTPHDMLRLWAEAEDPHPKC